MFWDALGKQVGLRTAHKVPEIFITVSPWWLDRSSESHSLHVLRNPPRWNLYNSDNSKAPTLNSRQIHLRDIPSETDWNAGSLKLKTPAYKKTRILRSRLIFAMREAHEDTGRSRNSPLIVCGGCVYVASEGEPSVHQNTGTLHSPSPKLNQSANGMFKTSGLLRKKATCSSSSVMHRVEDEAMRHFSYIWHKQTENIAQAFKWAVPMICGRWAGTVHGKSSGGCHLWVSSYE